MNLFCFFCGLIFLIDPFYLWTNAQVMKIIFVIYLILFIEALSYAVINLYFFSDEVSKDKIFYALGLLKSKSIPYITTDLRTDYKLNNFHIR